MQITKHSSPEGSRLPSSLLDTYVRYKQDTRAIITWLLSHGNSKYSNLKVVSIKDLVSLGAVVKGKGKEVVIPGTIDFCFREAIAASKWVFFGSRGEVGRG